MSEIWSGTEINTHVGSQTSNMSRPSKSGVAALLVVVLLLFLVRRLSTPARTVVFLRTKPEALPSSDPADHSRTVRSRPLSSLPLQSALPPRPPQLRRPPPPPPCTKLECTTKLQTLEPDWVQLSSQPRIDWAGGGVRGDCLVGEYDYMMKSPYCTPPGLPTPTGKKWPSPERLEAADVHSKHLRQHSVLKTLLQHPTHTRPPAAPQALPRVPRAICWARDDSPHCLDAEGRLWWRSAPCPRSPISLLLAM